MCGLESWLFGAFGLLLYFEPAGRALLRIAQRYRAGVLSRDARRSTTPPVTLLTMWRGATARRRGGDELQADLTVSHYREALEGDAGDDLLVGFGRLESLLLGDG